MHEDISKLSLFVLLIMTMVISILCTLTVVKSIENHQYSDVQEQQVKQKEKLGTVSLSIMEPREETGTVSLQIIRSDNNGQ